MRLLTIRQPWAEAIAELERNPEAKRIENRGQGFPKSYRGLLGIHAAAAISVRGVRSPLVRSLWPEGLPDVARGAVIALADLVDVHPAAGCCAPWGEESYPPANAESRPPGIVTHLVLEHVRRIEPVPARGMLGLWRPDEDLAVELAHRLAELVTWDLEAARRVADRGDVEQLWSLVLEEVRA